MSILRPSRFFPTSRAKLAASLCHVPTLTPPAQHLVLPSRLSMWLNNAEGDCIAAGEAAAKACSGIFVSDDTVQAWAQANDDVNGGDIESLLTTMQTAGFQQDGNIYNDGPHLSVNWSNPLHLNAALVEGPVKLGVSSAQLQNVPGIGVTNGWFATGFKTDTNYDHDTELFGYGDVAWLAQCFDVALPHGVDGAMTGYALFTWGTVGIIDAPSLGAIVGEAWLRNPTTVIVGANPPTPDTVTTFPANVLVPVAP
jgi:hypothetical protein